MLRDDFGEHPAAGPARDFVAASGMGGNAGRRLPEWLDLPEPKGFRPKTKYRTVWISDVHLGTRGCNAGLLVEFLRSVECETLYLVGDIIDGWRLKGLVLARCAQ
jgi:hypothetical protein